MSKVDVINGVMDIFTKDWNKQVILYGPPGTSKTYSSTIIAAKLLGCEDDQYEKCKKYLNDKEYKKDPEDTDRFKLVQFHPSYCYEDFVRGIKAQPEAGTMNYKVEPQIFENFCKAARDELESNNIAEYTYNKDIAFVFVIDEINRAPLASVLGELIYALEYRGQSVASSYTLEGSDDGLIVPPNVYIIGTMNTADRSIGSIDYAVRRRFAFVQVGSEETAIKGSWDDKGGVGSAAENLYKDLMDKENGIFKKDLLADPDLDVEDIKIGHTYFLGKPGAGEDYLKYRLQYQVIPIYLEYIKDGIIKKEGKINLNKILEKYEEYKGLVVKVDK